MESAEKIELLLSRTSIRDDAMKDALRDIYVRGYRLQDAAALNLKDKSNVHANMQTLEDLALMVELIKELDWGHLPSGGKTHNGA